MTDMKGISRRSFLTGSAVLGGAAALAGLAGCSPAPKDTSMAETGSATEEDWLGEAPALTEADCDPEWIGQYWDYEGRYQRFICWDENNNKPTYWDAEACQWEGEKHKIPTTGTWIEHPYKPIIADAWLPDPSKFADPADPAYDAYWTGEGNEKGAKSNPKGLPKDRSCGPTACRSSSPMAR